MPSGPVNLRFSSAQFWVQATSLLVDTVIVKTMEITRLLLLALLALLAGCGSGDEIDGLYFEADIRVMESFPVQIQGVLKVENRGKEGVILTSFGCPLMMRVYQDDQEVWDQGEAAVCPAIFLPLEVEPGQEVELTTPVASASQILGDELENGEYSVSVYIVAPEIEEPTEFRAGEVELAQ